jgi:hypothetical protein
MLLVRGSDVKGKVQNPTFVKNLMDTKTRRPMDRGIKAELMFFKDKISPLLIEILKRGLRRDVSIGFTYDEDPTTGKWRGEAYDFVQRNIFIDHVAAGIPVGRCPTPFCGIGIDSLGTMRMGLDPWEETEEYIRSGHRSPNDFDPTSFRTINLTSGVKAVTACPKGKYVNGKCAEGMQVQSYLFDKSKFTMTEAKKWFQTHKQDSLNVDLDCPLCHKIDELGKTEFSKRLIKAFGKDAVLTAVKNPEEVGTIITESRTLIKRVNQLLHP